MSQTVQLIIKSTTSFSAESQSAVLKRYFNENGIYSKGPFKLPNEHHFLDEVRVKFFVRSFWLDENSLGEHRETFISMIETMPTEIKIEMVLTDDEPKRKRKLN